MKVHSECEFHIQTSRENESQCAAVKQSHWNSQHHRNNSVWDSPLIFSTTEQIPPGKLMETVSHEGVGIPFPATGTPHMLNLSPILGPKSTIIFSGI